MPVGIYEKSPIFFSDLTEYWISSTDFRNVLILNFMTLRPVGAEIFYAELRRDGHRADMTKLIVAFKIWRTRLTMIKRSKK